MKKLAKKQSGGTYYGIPKSKSERLKELKDEESKGAYFSKKNVFGKSKIISAEKYLDKKDKYTGKKGTTYTPSTNSYFKTESMETKPRQSAKRSVTMTKPIEQKRKGGVVKSKKK